MVVSPTSHLLSLVLLARRVCHKQRNDDADKDHGDTDARSQPNITDCENQPPDDQWDAYSQASEMIQ